MMSQSRFRKVALSLPEATEGAHQGHADFRVKERIFATLGYPDENWGMVKLTPEQQSMLVDAEPEVSAPCRADGAEVAPPMCGWRRPMQRR